METTPFDTSFQRRVSQFVARVSDRFMADENCSAIEAQTKVTMWARENQAEFFAAFTAWNEKFSN